MLYNLQLNMKKILKSKNWLISIIFFLVISVGVVVYFYNVKQNMPDFAVSIILEEEKNKIKNYDLGLKYYNNKRYSEAAYKFILAGDYKDAVEKLEEVNKCIFKQLEDFSKQINIEVVTCKAGTFAMGSPDSEKGHYNNETLHIATIYQPFAIGKYEVTQDQYESIIGKNPSKFVGLSNPVEGVNWYEAVAFCEKLNQIYSSQLPVGYKFDLPTETQWEYSCRAGTITALNNGKDLISETNICYNLNEIAWYESNSESKTHPVGQKKPNSWGIYDMHGNVWEWCKDCYGDYQVSSATKEIKPDDNTARVFRGGSWGYDAKHCRAAYRHYFCPPVKGYDLGFRIAIVPSVL